MADSKDYSEILGLTSDRIKNRIAYFTKYIVDRSVGIVKNSNIKDFDKFMDSFTQEELKFFASGFLINKTEETLINMSKSDNPKEAELAKSVIKIRKEMLSKRTQN